MFLFFPTRSKTDAPGVELCLEFWCSCLQHIFITDCLKGFEVSTLITKLSVFETETAVPWVFADVGILTKWHEATFTGGAWLGIHIPTEYRMKY